MSWERESKRSRGRAASFRSDDDDGGSPGTPASAFGGGTRSRNRGGFTTPDRASRASRSSRSPRSPRSPGSLGSRGSRGSRGTRGTRDNLSAANPPGSLASGSDAEPVIAGRDDDYDDADGDNVVNMGDSKAAESKRDTPLGNRSSRNLIQSGGVNHSLGRSNSQRLARFVMKGPLAQQPVERPRDPRYSCMAALAAGRALRTLTHCLAWRVAQGHG